MNKYLQNLNKIEFSLTNVCAGNCKHCSSCNKDRPFVAFDLDHIEPIIKSVADNFTISTVMVFGGEPLLFRKSVITAMNAAREMSVEKRQIITSGYFSPFENEVASAVNELRDCGVNEILLSADAFHQETIPLDIVLFFAKETKKAGIPIFIQPAWLVDKSSDNPYNEKTREILHRFEAEGFKANSGNTVFFEGNARIHLKEYFGTRLPENPYVQDPFDVKTLSVSPDGSVLSGNVYKEDILSIIRSYNPKR